MFEQARNVANSENDLPKCRNVELSNSSMDEYLEYSQILETHQKSSRITSQVVYLIYLQLLCREQKGSW